MSNPLISSSSITYRNAIYEGQINQQNQTRKDFGIVYVAKTHEFICCNNWHNDNLEGECLFFNDHKHYIYGTWIGNVPQGFNVFRFDEVLFMAEFNRGKLSKNSKVLVIFEKYNLAAVLLVLNDSDKLDDLQLQVYSKSQVFSPEDINNLFAECRWPHEYFIQNQTLIKYVSHKLTQHTVKYENSSKPLQPKLRLIDNKYYRFGYDEGLAIVFDQDFNRISVGCHSKNKLKSFGIVFDQKSKPLTPYNKPQQGKIIKIQPQNNILKTALKNQALKSQNSQQTKILKTNLLMGVNFCNKFFKNPSKVFASYIQNIVSQQSIKKIIAGSLTTRRMFEESLDFSKIQENNDVSSDLFQKDLKKPNAIAPITHEKQQTSRIDKEKLLGDRLRLQAIKKQIYDSLDKRKHITQQMLIDEEYSREFINKQMVGNSHYNNHLQTPERIEKSKSRRRIFQESEKNLKLLRDFTPTRSEPNLTPFKTKMKNRIFHGKESKNSMSRQKNQSYESQRENKEKHSRKQIFENQEADYNERYFQEQNHSSNKFSSKHSNAKESRSQGKIRDLRYRDSGMARQDQRVSFKIENPRHVTFEEKVSVKDSLQQNHNSKQIFESGKSPQYVPINPSEQKERKRSIQNPPSHKNSRSSYIQQSKSSNNLGRQNKYQNQRQEPQQRLTPKSKYYLEEKSSKYLEIKPSNYQNDSRKGQTQSPKNLEQGYKQQYNRERRESQNQRQTPEANFIYQDETFKQTTLPEEFESNQFKEKQRDYQQKQRTQEYKQRQSAFKHSNEVYLEQLKQKNSQINSTQTQTQGYYGHKRSQNPANRTMPYMLAFEDRSKSKDTYNNSYRVKHKMKKSMEKEISRSPDRVRCYGKNLNNPYIEASPKYAKQGTYMMSYNKYESPKTMSRNDNYQLGSMAKNPRAKLF